MSHSLIVSVVHDSQGYTPLRCFKPALLRAVWGTGTPRVHAAQRSIDPNIHLKRGLCYRRWRKVAGGNALRHS